MPADLPRHENLSAAKLDFAEVVTEASGGSGGGGRGGEIAVEYFGLWTDLSRVATEPTFIGLS